MATSWLANAVLPETLGRNPGSKKKQQQQDGSEPDVGETDNLFQMRSPSGKLEDVENDAPQSPMKDTVVMFFCGIPIHTFFRRRQTQMMFLTATVIVSSVTSAAIQERVLYVPGFHFTGFISTVTLLTYSVCSLLSGRLDGISDSGRKGSLKDYAKLSVLTMGGMYMTNWSLKYLSYPLRVVFKSSKVIPTMALSVCYVKKKYTRTHYCSVFLLATGVIMFTLGDARGKAGVDIRGLVAIMIGVFAESFAANLEEKRFFNQLGCPANEVLLYSSSLGAVLSMMADLAQGDVFPAIRHSQDHPEALLFILISGVTGFISMTSILFLVQHFGATLTEIVKSLRKIATISLSFVLYGKPWTVQHVIGGLLFTASVAIDRHAAGGASRRWGRYILGAPVAAALYLFISTRVHDTYSIVIDAGGTGTRITIFRFDAWTLKPLWINGNAQVFKALPVGIGSFGANPDGVKTVIEPLMKVAFATVPTTHRAHTPLEVRANVGLADLPGPQATFLIAEVTRLVETYGFAFETTLLSYLQGADEAEYAWLTVNFLMGSFRPGVQAVDDPCSIVDLRSTSVQTAHFVKDFVAEYAKRDGHGDYIKRVVLPFGSGRSNIYRHSYIGYGLIGARKLSFERLHGRPHPCVPVGVEIGLKRGFQEFHAVGALPKKARHLQLPDDCSALVSDLLVSRPSLCGEYGGVGSSGGCSFAEVWSAPPKASNRRLVLMSYFFSKMQLAGQIESDVEEVSLQVSGFHRGALQACSVSADDYQHGEPDSVNENMWLCFDLTYMFYLLRSLGLQKNQTINVVDTIEHNGKRFQASWALGLVISKLSR